MMKNYYLRRAQEFPCFERFVSRWAFIIKALILCSVGFLLFIMPDLPVCLAQRQTPSSFDVTLEELGYNDHVLWGPEDRGYYYFGLPPGWQPRSDSYLELNLEYDAILQEEYAPAVFEVQLNGKVLEAINLETSENLELQIEIPPETLLLAEDQYLNELQLSLDVYAECEQALRVSMSVLRSSSFHFVYEESPLLLDLANYPKPLYQPGSFKPNAARLVLPAEPTEGEVTAAVMTAAGLGRLTGNRLTLTTSLASDLPPVVSSGEHLLVIGQPDHSPLIRRLDLPLALTERQLALRSEVPLTVTSGQAFSYTLFVKNTSSRSRSLALHDRWDVHIEVLDCSADCEAVPPDALRWNIGTLKSGQTISMVVRMQLKPETVFSEEVAHTASLLGEREAVINVDTLGCGVSATGSDEGRVASSFEKGPYFFFGDTYAVSESDGLIQEVIAPWSNRHVIFVVTGLNENALVKAGQALSADSRFPGMTGTYAIVQAIQSFSETVTPPLEEMPLASLGYADRTLGPYESLEFVFDVPRSWSPTVGSGLMLHYAYGSALSKVSGTLEIELNYMPIYSIPLDKQDVQNALREIDFPQTRLRNGSNRLSVQVAGDFPKCMSDLFAKRFWATIYSDSLIRLPHNVKTEGRGPDLGDFPQPFSRKSDLSDVVFSLPVNPSLVELNGLLQLASLLGSASKGYDFSPQVVLGDAPHETQWRDSQLIALGRPTSNPYIAVLNDFLPQPFIPGTDEIQQRIDNVIYAFPPDYSLGYIQLLASPWDAERIFLIATGSTDEGVTWALDALTDDNLRYQLAGNLAILAHENTIRTTDTREQPTDYTELFSQPLAPLMVPKVTATPMPTATPSPTITPSPTAIPLAEGATTPAVVRQRPIWLFPLLIVSVLTVAVTVGIALWRARN